MMDGLKKTLFFTIVAFLLYFPFPVNCSYAADIPEGAVAYWSFEEGSGDVAGDEVGDNDGTVIGAIWTTSGKSGNALSFDGVDDYVNMGGNTRLKPTSAITLEAWVNPDDYADGWGGAGFIMADGRDCCGNTGGVGLHLRGSQIPRGYIWDANSIKEINGLPMQPGEWHHIVFTFNGTSINLYQDGQLTNSTSFAATAIKPSGWDFLVGVLDANGMGGFWYFFHGLIDEVIIYDRALTAAEVQERYLAGARVAYWKFDEGSGNIAGDEVGDNDGTIIGATWTTNGKSGSALSFDGTNDYVPVLHDPSIMPTSALTLETWVYLKQTPLVTARIFSKWQINNLGYVMEVHSGNHLGLVLAKTATTFDAIGTTVPLTLNQWHHIVGTWDGSKVKIYLNGDLNNSKPHTTQYASTAPLEIGGSSFEGRFWNGFIDEVAIYDQALTADEIQARYRSTAPKCPSNVSPIPPNNINISLLPTLSASSFSDPDGNSHQASQWQITTTSNDYSLPVYEATTTGVTSHTIITALETYTTYYWHVRYQDDIGVWSDWSQETSFTASDNSPPATPEAISPVNETGVSIIPTLIASDFSDPDGDSHRASRWQVRPVDSAYGDPDSYDSGVSSDLTSHKLGAQGGWPAVELEYRRLITLTPAIQIANYQTKIELTPANFDYSKAKSDGADIRFYDNVGNSLNYWIETWDTEGTSIVWIKIPVLGADTIYLYYGNPSASSESNGFNTFEVFDDFNRANVGFNWTQYGDMDATIWSIENNRLKISDTDGSAYSYLVYNKNILSGQFHLSYDVYFAGNARWGGPVLWSDGSSSQHHIDWNPSRYSDRQTSTAMEEPEIPTVNNNQWYLTSFVLTGNTLYWYQNGTLVYEDPLVGNTACKRRSKNVPVWRSKNVPLMRLI